MDRLDNKKLKDNDSKVHAFLKEYIHIQYKGSNILGGYPVDFGLGGGSSSRVRVREKVKRSQITQFFKMF